MKHLFILIFVCLAASLGAQSIEDLEAQLKDASSRKEKMLINYEIAKKYLRVDTDKAIEYAKRTHEQARNIKNNAMAAQSAYLTGQAYERKRNDRNAEVWYKSAFSFAKSAKDIDLVVKVVNTRGKLAKKDRSNKQRQINVYEEAFNYLSNLDFSINDQVNQFEMQKAQLERARRDLEGEIIRLRNEKTGLIDERDQLSTEKTVLERQQKNLQENIQQAEATIDEKEEELESVTQEKERIKKKSELQIDRLTKDMLADSLVKMQLQMENQEKADVLQARDRQLLMSAIGIVIALILALFAYMLYRSSRRAKRRVEEKNKIIDDERKRSDELLLNILPANIAKELKDVGRAKARKYEEVTVLFLDFKTLHVFPNNYPRKIW